MVNKMLHRLSESNMNDQKKKKGRYGSKEWMRMQGMTPEQIEEQ